MFRRHGNSFNVTIHLNGLKLHLVRQQFSFIVPLLENNFYPVIVVPYLGNNSLHQVIFEQINRITSYISKGTTEGFNLQLKV